MTSASRPLIAGAALALVYAVAADVGIHLASLPGSSLTLIWLPSGIALAALLRLGTGYWPAIFLGSFFANASAFLHWQQPSLKGAIAATAVAAIDTLQPLLGRQLVLRRHAATTLLPLMHMRQVLWLMAGGAVLPVLPTVALLVLINQGYGNLPPGWPGFLTSYLSIALADMLGILLLAPALLTLPLPRPQWPSQREIAELGLCIATLLVALQPLPELGIVPSYLALLPLLWLATRFDQAVVILAVALFGILIIAATAAGHSPFVLATPWQSFLGALLFLFTMSIMTLLISALWQELRQGRDELEARVRARTQELEEAHRAMAQLAYSDALTGLANRRHFLEFGRRELERARRQPQTPWLLLLDIDHFKDINDTYGHDLGDAAIRFVADACAASIRAADLCARLGGDEFGVLLPDADEAEACLVAERVRTSVHRELVLKGIPLRLTISIGMSRCLVGDSAEESLERTVVLADRELYRAKQAGRNNLQYST